MMSDDERARKPYSNERWHGSKDELQEYAGESLDDTDVNLETRKSWDKVMKAFDKAYEQNKKKK